LPEQAHQTGDPDRAAGRLQRAGQRVARLPPTSFFLTSAIFHYLGPSLAVLLFAHVDVLGVTDAQGARGTFTTEVQFHDRIGWVYFALVKPFHKRLIPRLVSAPFPRPRDRRRDVGARTQCCQAASVSRRSTGHGATADFIS